MQKLLGALLIVSLCSSAALAGPRGPAFFLRGLIAKTLFTASEEGGVFSKAGVVRVELTTRIRDITVIGGKNDPMFWKGPVTAEATPRTILLELSHNYKNSTPRLTVTLDIPGRYTTLTNYDRALLNALQRRLETLGLPAPVRGDARVAIEDYYPLPQIEGAVDPADLAQAERIGVPRNTSVGVSVTLGNLSEAQAEGVLREVLRSIDTLVNEGLEGLERLAAR